MRSLLYAFYCKKDPFSCFFFFVHACVHQYIWMPPWDKYKLIRFKIGRAAQKLCNEETQSYLLLLLVPFLPPHIPGSSLNSSSKILCSYPKIINHSSLGTWIKSWIFKVGVGGKRIMSGKIFIWARAISRGDQGPALWYHSSKFDNGIGLYLEVHRLSLMNLKYLLNKPWNLNHLRIIWQVCLLLIYHMQARHKVNSPYNSHQDK